MPVKQITVFLENQTGRLAGVTRILKEKNINLQGFSTTEARDYGILRLVVSDVDEATARLKNAGYTTYQTPFGYFLDLDIKAPGHSFSRLFKEM